MFQTPRVKKKRNSVSIISKSLPMNAIHRTSALFYVRLLGSFLRLLLASSSGPPYEKLGTWWPPEDDRSGVFLLAGRKGSTAVCPFWQSQCALLHRTSSSFSSCHYESFLKGSPPLPLPPLSLWDLDPEYQPESMKAESNLSVSFAVHLTWTRRPLEQLSCFS